MKVCVCRLMVLVFCFSFAAAAENRMFSDKEGRSIEAELIDYNESTSQVTIKRAGSRSSVRVPIGIFSEDDQQYIRDWATYQEFLGSRLQLDFSRMDEQVDSRATAASTEIYTHRWFKLKFENRANTTFENLTLEYVIYYDQEHHTHGGADVEMKRGAFYRKETITLPAHEDVVFETEPVKLYTWKTISLAPVDAEMVGIRVRLTLTPDSGKPVVRNFFYPDNLADYHLWTDKTADAEVKIKF